MNFTLIVPFYRNGKMLERQLQEWEHYPRNVQILVVDDGSPEPAEPILQTASDELKTRLRLYRIMVDIPWNREGARNLASKEAETDWIVHVDIDHLMPVAACEHLVEMECDSGEWYRFPRFRVGMADDTRRKDKIPSDATFGAIHPHIDSYLITRETYWKLNGYDEDYVGVLGGGCAFLRQLEGLVGPPKILPSPVCLHVYTSNAISDASVTSLSRDTSHGKEIERFKNRKGNLFPKNPIRFQWQRVLL